MAGAFACPPPGIRESGRRGRARPPLPGARGERVGHRWGGRAPPGRTGPHPPDPARRSGAGSATQPWSCSCPRLRPAGSGRPGKRGRGMPRIGGAKAPMARQRRRPRPAGDTLARGRCAPSIYSSRQEWTAWRTSEPACASASSSPSTSTWARTRRWPSWRPREAPEGRAEAPGDREGHSQEGAGGRPVLVGARRGFRSAVARGAPRPAAARRSVACRAEVAASPGGHR